MKKIAVFVLPLALFAAGLLLGAFALVGQPSAQASVPAQVADVEGWSVQNFRSINFEPGRWEALGQVGSCGVLGSTPDVGQTASVFVRTETSDFTLVYPNQGSRVTVCAGFTAFFPPKSSGTVPADLDR